MFFCFVLGNEGYPSISDYEDASSSSSSGDENETDTEIEFNSKPYTYSMKYPCNSS